MGKGGKAHSQHVEQLVAKGFGRTKATQALKDAGNNPQLALRLLQQQAERSRAAAEPRPRPLAQPTTPQSATLCEEPEEPPKRVRLHPCLVQYGSCQFGEHCRLQHLPGDTCINYYNGSCIYGDACRRRHTVDGVDIREGQRQRPGDTFTREDGVRYRLIGSSGSGGAAVQVAQLVEDDDAVGDEGLQATTINAPEPSAFSLVRGSEPTHTDPLPHAAARMAPGTVSIPVTRPQPFLDKLRAASAPMTALPVAVATTAAASGSSEAAVGPMARHAAGHTVVNGRTHHPCIAQLGDCKYGAACAHADRAADVCVFYLNGRCRFTEVRCKYRHEATEACAASLRSATVPFATKTARALGEPAKGKNRLQGLGGGEPPPNRPSAGGRGRTTVLAPAASHACGGTWSVAAGGDSDSSGDTASEHRGDDGTALADAELDMFLCLLEAFPHAEPALVLHALRSSDGDPAAVADLVGHVEEATPADVDAALARVLVEEEEAEEEAQRQAREEVAKSESLMTLCFLFPALELASIEAVFHRSADCFEEAYEVLLCSQENITRREYGSVWSGSVGPADQLRVAKLCGMFPEMHPDVVRSTFGASNKDFTATAAALNNLALELLSLRTRAAMGEEALRWRPHASSEVGRRRRASLRPAVTFASDAEVRALYREAESELRAFGDWRRVRQRAYAMNTCRIRVLSQASAAYLRGDGALAKALSREGRDLGAEYERLNRLAMVALETERLATDAATTLDLHGFHGEEAKGVLARRVELCHRKHITRLHIIVGEGHHSRRGGPTLYPVVRDFLSSDARMVALVQLTSIKPGLLEARIR